MNLTLSRYLSVVLEVELQTMLPLTRQDLTCWLIQSR